MMKNLFDKFLPPKAPSEPPGDYTKENADVIKQAEAMWGELAELWESECVEAGRARNIERTREAADIAALARMLREKTPAFYRKWRLRQ